MKLSNFLTNIQLALDSGKINEYMAGKVSKISNNGLDDNLVKELLEDAQNASDAGVGNDKQYNEYFYICHFLNDLLKDVVAHPKENNKIDFCKFCFLEENKEYELDDLTNLRILLHKWLNKNMHKKAYPNISGKYTREPTQDLDKWIRKLNEISSFAEQTGLDKSRIFDSATADWDTDERNSFKHWVKYYEEGNTEKYNVKTAQFVKKAFGPFNLPDSLLNRTQPQTVPLSTFRAEDNLSKKELELEKAKSIKVKIKSRVRALKSLIDKYNDILPNQDLEKLYSEVHSLEKSVSKLNVYAMIQDNIIKTANKMIKLGFDEGAEFLFKVAAEPVNKEVIQSLPPPTPSAPNLPEGSKSMVNVQTVLARLDGINKRLASRDLIRELASVDILLNELGMASLFPELSLAQSKLIEAFGYASNKVEDTVSRLRGVGTSKKKEKIEPAPLPTSTLQKQDVVAPKPVENVKTEELIGKPMGKVETSLPEPTKK